MQPQASGTPLRAFLTLWLGQLFEPAMVEGGVAAPYVGALIGSGLGRGIGLLTVSMGLCLVVTALVSYLIPSVRWVEDELPDA